MDVRAHAILILGALCAAGCAAQGTSTVAHAEDGAAAVTWLELGGSRMLVTTTRAAGRRAEGDLPILVVLPWSHSTPEEILAEVGYVDIAVPARIIAIEGFERDGAGFSWWRRTRPAPADPDRDDELVALLTDRADRLARLLGVVRDHFGSASAPVVSGVSQGGDLSVALGVLHPASIRAALPIAARFPASMLPARSASTIPLPPIDAFHGTADPVAPAAALQRAFTTLHDRGYPVALHLHDGVAHEVSPALRAGVQACAALRLRGVGGPC